MQFQRRRSSKVIICLVCLLANFWAISIGFCDDSEIELVKIANEQFGVVPKISPDELNRPRVELGKRLFWDDRISRSGKIACASCHLASDWGAHAEQFSKDANGKLTKRNSQTVFNATMQPHLRWTGDRKSAAHQAEKSLTGSMGFANASDVIPLLKQHDYEAIFQEAFPSATEPLSPGNYATAIEAYEATLTTPAPFDEYLLGRHDALTKEQKDGLKRFIDIGCADCHRGTLLGGESLEVFGLHHEYWAETKSTERDIGLMESTKDENDRFRFRTAMLRNIEHTGPYFHDGSVASLEEAVRVMAKVQLDKDLANPEIESLLSFLKSLTGEVPSHYAPQASIADTAERAD